MRVPKFWPYLPQLKIINPFRADIDVLPVIGQSSIRYSPPFQVWSPWMDDDDLLDYAKKKKLPKNKLQLATRQSISSLAYVSGFRWFCIDLGFEYWARKRVIKKIEAAGYVKMYPGISDDE